ncbi:MAG: cobS [Solirubrobacterales bacterium]|nr:cobS [Solirubrobacterales bacterium]
MAATLRRTVDGAVYAITFLTVVPLRVRDGHDGAGTAPAWYALVGAAIGAAAGGVFAAAKPGLGSSVAAILAVAALVVVTGGLHQDGLADCADGLGVRGDRDRRLAVMRDPATGSFGALALVLWALLLTMSLAQLETGEAIAALITAAAVGRWSALLHAQWAPPARTDGLGSAFSPSTVAVIVAGLTAVGVAAIADIASAGAVVFAGLLVAAAASWWSRRAVGGRTGDTLGATAVLTELVVVLVLLAFARN